MDISRRGDYACRMLRAVCLSEGERISVSDISRAEGIPYSFARSIQHDLVKAGLLVTARGARGGVSIARDLRDVTLLEVLLAVEGTLAISPCSGDPSYCARSGNCAYNRVWCNADKMIADYFGSITLADLFAPDAECCEAARRVPEGAGRVQGDGLSQGAGPVEGDALAEGAGPAKRAVAASGAAAAASAKGR